VKNIEINSDKYTVLGILFVLALVLISFVSGLYHLMTHNVAFSAAISIWNYPAAIFSILMAVSIFRDSTLRKTYAYGMAGMTCLMIQYAVTLIAPWLRPPLEAQSLLWTTLRIIEIVGSTLVLAEGVRWFRKNSYWR
jgi:hypothetical protein